MNIGDRIENINPSSKRYGEEAEVTDITCDNVYVEYDDGDTGKCKRTAVSRYYKVVSRQNITQPNQTNVKTIISFAKNILLSASEKKLRKVGLKNDCGDFTSEARELVINKLVAENEDYLIDIATKAEEDSKED